MSLPAAALFAVLAFAATPSSAQNQTPPPADPAAMPPATEPAGPDAQQIAAHRRVLEKTITDMKAGRTDYGAMTPELAEKVRAGEAEITPALNSMGTLKSVEYVGLQQGALKFAVAFEQATTTWFIALGPDGKITFLVLRVG